MKKILPIAVIIATLSISPFVFAHEHEHVQDKKESVNKEKVREIVVVSEMLNDKNRYTPSVYIVKLGEKVRFKIFNATEKPHGFSIDAFKVQATLNPKDNIVEFIADKEGLFEVYCQYHPGHLRGQLLVVK